MPLPMFRPFACRAVLSIAALCSAPAAMPADLATMIDRAASASQATVLLVPSMALYRNRIDEGRLESAGCRYATSDPAAIHALVGLFKGADISVDAVYQALDLREGVYLTLSDGSLLKFFLQDNFGGRLPVKGQAETSAAGEVHSMTVTARQTLAADLRTWAARLGPGVGGACDRMAGASAHADPVLVDPAPMPR